MFGEFSLAYGAVAMLLTFAALMSLTVFDTADAEYLFSRRDK